jgi:hypothetical protein
MWRGQTTRVVLFLDRRSGPIASDVGEEKLTATAPALLLRGDSIRMMQNELPWVSRKL